MLLQKDKLNRSRRGAITFAVLMAFCMFAVLVVGALSQKGKPGQPIAEDKFRDAQEVDKEVQGLIEILSKKTDPPEIIFSSIQKLGRMKAKAAIPELIRYLDYERIYPSKGPEFIGNVKIDGGEISRTIPISGRYPAAGALLQIGEPALPQLIETIGNEEAGSVRSKNALYAIKQIVGSDLTKGLKCIQKVIDSSASVQKRERLYQAQAELRRIKEL